MPTIPNALPKARRFGGQIADLERGEYEEIVDARAEKLGAGPHAPSDSKYDSRIERIIADVNFLSVNFFSKGALLANSVCRIEMKVSGRWRPWGTGFLIAPDLVMTNQHVFEAPEWAEHARLLFKDELDVNDNPIAYRPVSLKPRDLFLCNAELDFAVCAVDGSCGNEYGFIRLNGSKHKISRHERVNIIQHPQGRRKEVVLQDNTIERVKQTVLLYRADTQTGSSGSPVFNNGWELVALHHAGGERDAESNAWLNNEGIRISCIVRRIHALAVENQDRDALRILRHVINYE